MHIGIDIEYERPVELDIAWYCNKNNRVPMKIETGGNGELHVTLNGVTHTIYEHEAIDADAKEKHRER